LETNYSAQDYLDVDTKNDIRVEQSGLGEYMIHQFKDYVGSETSCTLELEGQADDAPSSSPVYLQIYNRDTPEWETVDSDNTTAANTDFTLTAEIVDLTDYKDASETIVCRIYQLDI